MGVEMNLRIITKNHEADLKIRFLAKSISKPIGRATAMPTSWELRYFVIMLSLNSLKIIINLPTSIRAIVRVCPIKI